MRTLLTYSSIARTSSCLLVLLSLALPAIAQINYPRAGELPSSQNTPTDSSREALRSRFVAPAAADPSATPLLERNSPAPGATAVPAEATPQEQQSRILFQSSTPAPAATSKSQPTATPTPASPPVLTPTPIELSEPPAAPQPSPASSWRGVEPTAASPTTTAVSSPPQTTPIPLTTTPKPPATQTPTGTPGRSLFVAPTPNSAKTPATPATSTRSPQQVAATPSPATSPRSPNPTVQTIRPASTPAPTQPSGSTQGATSLIGARTPATNETPGPLDRPVTANMIADTTLTLNNLERLIAPPGKEPLPLHIVFPATGSGTLNDMQLAQGAAAAQGMALRCGYDPLVVSHGGQIRADAFNIMIGSSYDLQSYLLPSEQRQINHSFMALRRLVGAPGYLLLLTGTDQAAVSDAILALGFARSDLPEASTAAIAQVVIPTNPPFIRREPLQAGQTYTFGDLEKTNNPVILAPDGGLLVNAFLPGYVAVVPDREVSVSIHFAMRTQAFTGANTLVFLLNGKEAGRAQPGDVNPSPLGGSETTFTLPLEAFAPGRNVLHFTTAGAADSASRVRVEPEDLRIYADSMITMPEVEDPVVLPNLEVTARTFFPFIGQPDGSQVAFMLTDRSTSTVNAAWTLMARLAQMSNTFFYASEIGTNIDPANRNVVVVGRYNGIPKNLQDLLQLSAFEYQSLTEEDITLNEAVRGTNLRIVLENLWQRLLYGEPEQTLEDPQLNRRFAGSNIPEYLYFSCIPPDEKEDRSNWALILTAFTSQQLEEGTGRLVQPDVWLKLRGTISRLGESAATLQNFIPSEAKFIDANYNFVEMPTGTRMNLRFWWISSSVLLVSMIIVTMRLLQRIEATTHPRLHS